MSSLLRLFKQPALDATSNIRTFIRPTSVLRMAKAAANDRKGVSKKTQAKKAAAKKAGGADEEDDNMSPADEDFFYNMLMPTKIEKRPYVPEELARDKAIAQTYNKNMMKRNKLMLMEERRRIQLREAALAAMPEHLRKMALVVDPTPFPLEIHFWSDTPSPAGFGQDSRMGEGEQEEKDEYD